MLLIIVNNNNNRCCVTPEDSDNQACPSNGIEQAPKRTSTKVYPPKMGQLSPPVSVPIFQYVQSHTTADYW